FHADPSELIRALRANFPISGFSAATLGGNWTRFLTASLVVLGLLSLAQRLGAKLAAWIGRGDREINAEALIEHCGLGLGLLGSIVFGLGLDGLLFSLSRLASATLLGILGVYGVWQQRGMVHVLMDRMPPILMTWPTRAVAAGGVLICLVGVLSPELGWDALTYHLRLPSFFLLRHKVYDVWHNYYAPFPGQVEMLFLLGKLADSDLAARGLNASLGVLLLGASWTIARALGARSAWPTVLLTTSPLFLTLATRCYVDLGMAFYLAMGVALFLQWQRTGAASALVASGVLTGFGMGSKYVGVIMWLGLLASIGSHFPSRGRRRALAWWILASVLPLCPWLIKNWLIRGNPVFPFLHQWMGLTVIRPLDHRLPFEHGQGLGTIRAGLLDRVEALFFDAGHIDGPFLPILGGLLPLLAFRSLSSVWATARRVVIVYLLTWLILAPEARFLLPAIPLMLGLMFALLENLFNVRPAMKTALRWILEINVLAGVI
ncbi:MAG: glycosyltransferase family 39 protein, partial [Nanoarchaeota archaeon]